MDTFPAIEPVYSVAEEVNPLVKKNAFGDGYLQSIRFGLNFIKPDWNLQWLVSKAEASTIELFLKQQSEDGKWFYWTPPDSSSAVKWRCDEWTIEDLADSLVRVDANFRQVFELSLVSLVPEEVLCGGCPSVPIDNIYYFSTPQTGRLTVYYDWRVIRGDTIGQFETVLGPSNPLPFYGVKIVLNEIPGEPYNPCLVTYSWNSSSPSRLIRAGYTAYRYLGAPYPNGSWEIDHYTGSTNFNTLVGSSGSAYWTAYLPQTTQPLPGGGLGCTWNPVSADFDPYQYTYARAYRFGWYKSVSGASVVYTTVDERSSWFGLGDGVTSKYYLQMSVQGGDTGGWDVYSNEQPQWRSTVKMEYNGNASTTRSTAAITYLREFPNATFVATALSTIAVNANGPNFPTPNTGELLNIKVIWEFSNDANTVAATWDGYRNSYLLPYL